MYFRRKVKTLYNYIYSKNKELRGINPSQVRLTASKNLHSKTNRNSNSSINPTILISLRGMALSPQCNHFSHNT